MAAMSAEGSPVCDSEEVEILAYRKTMEFAIDAGFIDLVIEGDNTGVMYSISSPGAD